MDTLKSIAVLIDADNTQLSKIESVLHELSAYGRIIAKKAYGNWKKPTLKNWETEVKRLAIRAEQQFDYTSGKNTTDIAITIDAMDMLHTKMYDCFVLVSSDSDFTPLAIRLRESGVHIIGVGEKKTLEAFRNACDEFIFLEFLGNTETVSETAITTQVEHTDNTPVTPNINEIHYLLQIASFKYQDDDGYTNVSSAGSYIKRAKPDFDSRTYGYSKLPELIEAFPERYETRRYSGKGTVTIIAYKCLSTT